MRATISIQVEVSTSQELEALVEALCLKFDKTSAVKSIQAMTVPEQRAVVVRTDEGLVQRLLVRSE